MGTCWDRPESAVQLAAFRHQNQTGLIFLHPCWLWPWGGEDEEDTKQGMSVGHQGLILGT